MPTFSAADIVGKTLIAKETVPVYSLPNSDPDNLMGSIKPNDSVGVVFSWVGGYGSTPLYWQFLDKSGGYYYVMHKPGRFDVRALKDQGTMTTAEKQEAENPKSTLDKVLGSVKTIAILAAAAFVGKSLLDRN